MEKLALTFIKGKRVTTSVIVASLFSKMHNYVLCDIEQLSCSLDFRKSNFELTAYGDENHKLLPMFGMTKDGFLLVLLIGMVINHYLQAA